MMKRSLALLANEQNVVVDYDVSVVVYGEHAVYESRLFVKQ